MSDMLQIEKKTSAPPIEVKTFLFDGANNTVIASMIIRWYTGEGDDQIASSKFISGTIQEVTTAVSDLLARLFRELKGE